MSYPSTVDTGQVQPFALYSDDVTVLTAAAMSAGTAFFTAYILYAQVTVTQMRCDVSGTPTGNIDMGIYDATGANGQPGNLLGHTGATVATTGVFTKSLTANLTLSPGQYWIATLDTVADSLFVRTAATSGMGLIYKTSASNLTVLPATAGSLVTSGNRPGTMALLLNSFS